MNARRSSVRKWKERDCILFMGRLAIHQKGLDRLLEACLILKKNNHLIPKLIIAGPDFRMGASHISEFIQQHDMTSWIELRGMMKGKEKEDLFNRARLFVHTSRWEGLPLVLLEALSYGVPCLLTDGTNVASEWADIGCAFRVGSDPSEIANYLERLGYADLDRNSQTASNLAEREFSWNKIGIKLNALYGEILANN